MKKQNLLNTGKHKEELQKSETANRGRRKGCCKGCNTEGEGGRGRKGRGGVEVEVGDWNVVEGVIGSGVSGDADGRTSREKQNGTLANRRDYFFGTRWKLKKQRN